MQRNKVTALAVLLLIPLAAPLGGCYRPLFDKDLPANQFAQHDQARGGPKQQESTNAFGNPQPALRQRLMKE